MPSNRYLHTMDIDRDTVDPIYRNSVFPTRRYSCPICQHHFTIVGGQPVEICPGCDENIKADPVPVKE